MTDTEDRDDATDTEASDPDVGPGGVNDDDADDDESTATVECRNCGESQRIPDRSTRMVCAACGTAWAWVRCTRVRCRKTTAVKVGEDEPTCRYCDHVIKVTWPSLHFEYQRRLAEGIESPPPGPRLVLGRYWLHPDVFGTAGAIALGDAEYLGGWTDRPEAADTGALELDPWGVHFAPFGEDAFVGWKDVDALALDADADVQVLKIRTEDGQVGSFKVPGISSKDRRRLATLDGELQLKAEVLAEILVGSSGVGEGSDAADVPDDPREDPPNN